MQNNYNSIVETFCSTVTYASTLHIVEYYITIKQYKEMYPASVRSYDTGD